MKRRDFMIGSVVSYILAACGRKPRFSNHLIQSLESDFIFPLVQVPGKYTVEAWEYLALDKTQTPVVIGSSESLLYISEGMEFGEQVSVEEILVKAAALEFPNGLKKLKQKQFRELAESMKDNPNFKEMFPDLETEVSLTIEPSDILNDWPSGRASKNSSKLPSVAIDWSNEKPFDEVVIALVPTSDWTEVPAYMRFGGYNDCPASEWHVAALRHWRDLCGVQLVGVSHETLDLRIARHPETREEAAAQAIAIYDYCPDVVDQGSGSISELARDIMNHNWWYLWWD